MEGLRKDLWLAWCPKCGQVRYFGKVYRNIGWPFCDNCKVPDMKSPEWPGTPWKWVSPDDGDGVLRIWHEAEI